MSTDHVGSPGSKNRRQLPKVPSTNKPTSSLLKSSTSTSSLPSNTSRTTNNLEHSISQDALTGASKKLSPMKPRVIVPAGTIPENEGEDSCVTVAVRVRPFSEREIKLGGQLAIRMYEKETAITSPEGVVRKFYYDYSFWSFDRLRGSYADQEAMYSQIATPLLDQAFEGYNTCLFAYGQTGSGKSYCIMGEADNTGIIPRFAEELFTRIDSTTVEEGSSFKIEISFYEIYNEKIHDLLASTNKKNRNHLRVREHPVMGPYVEDLSTYVASSYKDIEHWITLGNKYRATAATGMNERSSRSHSVFTILFTQMSLLEGEEHSKVSRINLIDLAGSERSTLAQTSGDRLKEGASINRSLHTLGKVISLLAEKASSKRKKVFIPYRDSTLTWLLKDSLGGNSKTTMIATISPADLYHDESLSTLRYAHQARSIINVARVNEDPSARLIRDLRAEIDRLTGLLSTNSASFSITTVSQLLQNNGSHASDVEELQKKLKEAEKLMTECTRTWEERLLESERRKQEEAEELKKAGMSFKVDNKLPNLINLNEDPQLCEILVYALKEGTTSVGRLTSSSSCDIQLTGALVAPSHCEIQNDSNIVTMTTKGDAQTYINGNLTVTPTTLHHGDRLVIGGEHYFRFNHPGELADRGSNSQRSSLQDDTRRSFAFAHNEFIQAQTARIEAEVEEARLKEREVLMQEIQSMKQQAQTEFEQEKKVYDEKLNLLENELEQHEVKSKESAESNKMATIKIAELEEKNKKLEEETLTQRHLLQLEKLRMQKEDEEMRARKTRLITELEQEKQKLEMEVRNMQKLKETKVTTKATSLQKGSELVQISMLLQEANALSQALNKHVTFSWDAVYTSDGDSITRVKLTNSVTGLRTVWDLGKFESRLVQMRELMQGGQDNESVCSSISNVSEDDPFFDPKDLWEESFSSPSRSTPSHRSSSVVSWPMSPSSRPLPDLPPSIPKHLADALTSTKQSMEMGSPASETSSVTSETGNYTNVFQSLPSIPSLCRERVNNLLLALNDNHGGVAQDSVYQSILMSGWEVSKAARDMTSFLKSALIPQHNVPLSESSDFRQSSINLQTSLELLVNSFYHLSCTPQQVPQLVDPDLSPLHYRSKLLDTIRVLTTHIAQVLECIDSEMESAIQSSVRCIRDTVESIFSVCGQLSLAECTLSHLCSKQPVQEDKTWKEQLPFKIRGHFYSGQCEYTEAVLVKIASCIELKTIGQHTEGGSDVVTCANQLLIAIVNLIQEVADAQDQMWPSAEEQNDLEYCSAPNAPSLNRVTEMLTLAYRVLSHVTTLCNCAGMERIDCDHLTHYNTDTAGACTQLAASVLNVIKSSGYEQDILTTNIQNLSREIMRSGKNLNHAAKRYRQHISYRVGMSMATGQVTLTNFADDGII